MQKLSLCVIIILVVLTCGIDGLPGENGGIQLVRDSLLDASYIYPTHGDQIIDLAIRILDGQPYEKETMQMSALVTCDNAKVLLMESEEIMRQAEQLDSLHKKADSNRRAATTPFLFIVTLFIACKSKHFPRKSKTFNCYFRKKSYLCPNSWRFKYLCSELYK